MDRQLNNNDMNILNRNFNAARKIFKNVTMRTSVNHIISALTGQQIAPDNFISRNVQASFGRNVKQDIRADTNQPILSSHIGNTDYRNKRSSGPLFTPISKSGYNTGAENGFNEIRSRMHTSQYRENELPFEQITVGKGLGKNGGAAPSGGFHPYDREHIMPKNIDELRVSSNPKMVYNGVTTNKKEINNKRTRMGTYEKRTADTFYIQTPDNYIRTTGAVIKEEQRPAIYIKDNNRKESINYTPSANPTNKAGTQRALYKRSTKNNYKADGPRNLHKNDSWINTDFGDYGRQTITNKPNERTTSETKNPLSNFNSIFKAIIAPLLDVLKTTKKENFIGNVRPEGNMQVGIPSGIAKDKNDVARPTIKETVIENSHTGHIKGSFKLTAYDPKDVARKTIKETNIENSHTGHIKGSVKLTAYDPTDVTRKTIKETNIENSHNGNLTGNTKPISFDPTDTTRTTIKETNIINSHTGNLTGNTKPISFDPNDIARTTIKETNIDNSHLGNLTGPIKLTTYDPNDIVSLTNRQFTSDISYAGHAENQGHGMGYTSNPQNAPNTNRQTTSDREYSGGAGSYYKKSTSYDAALSSNINLSKEKTLKGRRPTPESVKLTNGGSAINMTTDKLFTDGINSRSPAKGKVYINSYTNNSIHSKHKTSYDTTILDEQINPILLKPFKNNPYTHSLSSI